jgi:protein-tyrosine phosphatase
MGFTHLFNPVADFGIPSSEQELAVYRKTILQAAELLENSNILIHCGAGIGRTGTFAVILLRRLGFDFETASTIVKNAGSDPETDEQRLFAKDFR